LILQIAACKKPKNGKYPADCDSWLERKQKIIPKNLLSALIADM